MNKGIPSIPLPQSPMTLGDRAFHEMRDMILTGKMAPGEWVRKRQVAKQLDMSTTPVVEAMRRLQHEGFIELNPQWGARVKTWTVPQIAQLADMRIALEGVVAKRATQILSTHQIEELRAIAEVADEKDSKFSNEEEAINIASGLFFHDDFLFHQGIARSAKLDMLAQEIDRLHLLQATCRFYTRPAIATVVTHQQILDSIASGEADKAEAAMRLHIESNMDHYLPRLRERFGDGPVIWNEDE